MSGSAKESSISDSDGSSSGSSSGPVLGVLTVSHRPYTPGNLLGGVALSGYHVGHGYPAVEPAFPADPMLTWIYTTMDTLVDIRVYARDIGMPPGGVAEVTVYASWSDGDDPPAEPNPIRVVATYNRGGKVETQTVETAVIESYDSIGRLIVAYVYVQEDGDFELVAAL